MSVTSRELEGWEREALADAEPAIEALRRRCDGCPPARVLSAASCDALPDDAQSAVNAHVESCEPCRALLADLEQLEPAPLESSLVARMLDRAVRLNAAPAAPAWRRWAALWVPVSVGTLAVLAVLFVPRPPVQVPAPAPPSVRQAAVPAPAPVPAAPPAVVPAPELRKPDVRLTMLALTWRSAGATEGGFAEAIAPALNAFRADRFEECERLLAPLSAAYPGSVEIPFYQGVSQLFQGRNQEAVTTLRRALRVADETFDADASWYLGIALARSGHAEEARLRFAALCRGKSTHAAPACEAAR